MPEKPKTRKPPPPPPTLLDKPPAESVKETVDSIIIALALALVFRAFIVEAFVIPTGSMAATLLGAHRHFVCPNCHFPFDVGLDGRADGPQNKTPEQRSESDLRRKNPRCPNCSYSMAHEDAQLATASNPDRGGDKILVFKFPYLLRDPDRWDVVVFYNPANPDENFIKRLIGRPGEKIQILDGDIFVAEPGQSADQMTIARKPPDVQRTLWRGVYLNDYPAVPAKDSASIFPRWAAPDRSGWKVTRTVDGKKDAMDRLLRYEPPASAPDDRRLTFKPESGHLNFTDFYAYNGWSSEARSYNVVWDLRLELVVTFSRPGGSVSLSMNHHSLDGGSDETPLHYVRPRFVATFFQEGRVELREFDDNGGRPGGRQVRQTETVKLAAPFPVGEGVPVALQNVDYRATACVDGKPAAHIDWTPVLSDLRANEGETARAFDTARPVPTVFIEPDGRTPLELRHVALLRDVYYTARVSRDTILRGALGSSEPIVDLRRQDADRPSPQDEFFVMGDNSPASSDGRLWRYDPPSYSYWHLLDSGRLKLDSQGKQDPDSTYRFGRVPRDHLIGKAFFVYWPAALPMAGGRLNAVPNVGRMRLIH